MRVDRSQPENSDLYFDEDGKPHLRRLPKRNEPAEAETLQEEMQSRLSERHRLNLLHHAHCWVPFTRHFGPPSGSDPKLRDPIDRYLITIFGYRCNLGPTQTARHLRDGTHYELHENNLLGERHIRYGAYGGVAYHHISDAYVALFSHFIACGMWEAVYILDGLLKNKAVIQPGTVHADTQGQSEVVFGLAHLRGIQLMPRMRNWNKVTMYRPSMSSRYQNIDSWFTRTINWDSSMPIGRS